MIPLPLSGVTPDITSMFSLEMPTGIRALAVLAGGNTGKILVDQPQNPSLCLVWEADDGTLYRGGQVDQETLSQAVSLLCQEGLVALGFRDGDPDLALFPPDPTAGAECLEFIRPPHASDLSPYLNRIPAGFTVQRMDRALLERSPKREENLNRYGSLENFLDRGIAFCVLHGEDIASEAYADMSIQGVREIGIRTAAQYRRQGQATLACAHLIQSCDEEGSATYWDCVRLNAGSVALARKLGFSNPKAYKLLAWFQQGQ